MCLRLNMLNHETTLIRVASNEIQRTQKITNLLTHTFSYYYVPATYCNYVPLPMRWWYQHVLRTSARCPSDISKNENREYLGELRAHPPTRSFLQLLPQLQRGNVPESQNSLSRYDRSLVVKYCLQYGDYLCWSEQASLVASSPRYTPRQICRSSSNNCQDIRQLKAKIYKFHKETHT